MNDHAFSLVTGVLAFVSAIASTLGYYHSRLPNQRMEIFDKIFSHSKELFSRARKDGLITASLWRAVSGAIQQLEASSLEARARVYASSRGLGAYVMRRELLKEINTLIEDAEALRLSIAVSDRLIYDYQQGITHVPSRSLRNNSCGCKDIVEIAGMGLSVCEALARERDRVLYFRFSVWT